MPTAGQAPQLDIRRAAERARTQLDGIDSRHSFSFGPQYDATNTHHGLLVAHNEDVVAPGSGYPPHRHQDLEIVTWVLSGTLLHEDDRGHTGVVSPGLVQRLSAGTGVVHSERSDAGQAAHFVQMWLVPDEHGLAPSYQLGTIEDLALRQGLVPVASGRPGHDAAIQIRNRDTTLHAGRLAPGQCVVLPEAPYLHLFVGVGAVDLEGGGDLASGDAARLTGTGGQRVTAGAAAEVLVWEMHRRL